ncbi:KpsF/GutQ family sugar-phosphate isomerase [uncultured Azonexus sp.]|uniref:KpsF/GutQ family sugar-phosphate isomerase n=1 Tax=uncultured Azonexus sp. TaxID=520307 RepID=UPI002613AA69|nr:KpsF/GutQ family sugar-phosphate isomerase [uncultured Azonexus sp.]
MDAVELARQVVATEIEALQGMAARLDGDFAKAIEIIRQARGRLVVVGMGKSGIIGKKIAATLASTGTPSFFVHPGEAFHGDLGMIKPIDVVLMISNSGETEELIRLLPFMEHQKNPVIAMTGKPESTLARYADVLLDVSVPREACNNNLAPTSSTTATLVMGDALAVVLSTLNGFQPEDFARFHPGGSLGRRLLTRVADVMHRGALPFCSKGECFKDVVHTITRGRLGLAIVMDGSVLQGVITDGDIRRAFDRSDDPLRMSAADLMTANPLSIDQQERFSVAEHRMREAKVNSLIVLDEASKVVGVLQIYDLSDQVSA